MAFLAKLGKEAVVEPMKPVGLRDYQVAKDHLSRNSGFDFDSFLEEVRTGTLFEQPLGPSSECLSINQVSDYAGSGGESLGAEGRAIKAHLEVCKICSQNVEIYRQLAERHSEVEEVLLEDSLP